MYNKLFILLYLVIFGIFLKNLKLQNRIIAENGFSRPYSAQINGVFVALVLLRHLLGNGGLIGEEFVANNVWFAKIDTFLGQLIVVSFLFYSGFGLMESVKNKEKYMNTFIRKRLLLTWLHFVIAVCIYLFIGYLFLDQKYTIKTIMLSFTGLESVGNSSWYMFVIFAMYIGFWFSYKVCNGYYFKMLLFFSFFTLTLSVVLILCGKDNWWYDTCFVMCFGCWVSYFKEKLLVMIYKNYFRCFLMCCMGFLLFYSMIFRVYDYLSISIEWRFVYMFIHWLAACFFVCIIVLCGAVITVNSPSLVFLNRHLFSIYILQRMIFSICFRVLNFFNIFDWWLYVVSAVALTILFSLLYDCLIKRFDMKIFCMKGDS